MVDLEFSVMWWVFAFKRAGLNLRSQARSRCRVGTAGYSVDLPEKHRNEREHADVSTLCPSEGLLSKQIRWVPEATMCRSLDSNSFQVRDRTFCEASHKCVVGRSYSWRQTSDERFAR